MVPFNLPEVPSSNDRFAAVRTSEDLVIQTFRTIIISKVESSIPILVLHHELNAHVAGPGAHGFQLERGVVAREHAAVTVAGIVDEAASFLWIEMEALASIPDAVPGSTLGFPHLSVGPGCAVYEALSLDALDAEGEHAGNSGED